MPISNEQWRVVVGLWVARIQQTLIIRRGVKRSPSSQEGAPCPLGQPHSGEKKCMVKKKGRKKAKTDSFGDPAITTGEFYDGLIALATIVSCLERNRCKDGSYRNPVGPLLEVLEGNSLSALVVIVILLLRNGDVKINAGPVERGAHSLLNISSKPALAELDKFIVRSITDGWEQMIFHLGVESFVMDIFKGANPGHSEEACLGVLSNWLNAKPGTGEAERTSCSVLEALETSGHRQLADKLKREQFGESSETLVSEPTSPPGVLGGGKRQEHFRPSTAADPGFRGQPPWSMGCGDMPISNEQWRVVVGLWVARIQQTPIIRSGVKKSPSSQEGAPCPLGQPHSGQKKWLVKKKGRKEAKNDLFGDPAITTDEFYDSLIGLAMIVSCLGRNKYKGSSYRNPVYPLLEVLGGNSLGALVVITILLLRSGDVETNPSPVERGAHGLVNISSKPTLAELNEFIVRSITDGWKQVMFHLRVESFMIDILKGDNPGQLEEASQIVLSNWLNAKSGTGVTERTWRSVLKALERSQHKWLADKLKREQLGAHTLLNISSKPTLAEPDEFIVRSIADGWEQVVLHLQNDFFGGLAITTDEFYDDLIATATIVSGLGRNHCKDSSYRNLVGPLLEVLGGNGLGALVVIAILLLQSGDVETNPGPVERAEEVLKEYRKQFINDVEADVVVSDLQFSDIIPQGCNEQISRTVGRVQRNEILHDRMVTNCTKEALIAACNIFIAKEGYPRMKALGEAMKNTLETGAHALLDINSKPTLAELDRLIVHLITDGWEQVLLHLAVESSVIDIVKGANPGRSEEAYRGVLNIWLNAKPGTGVAERTWHSVLEALETSGHRHLADKLKREHFGESSGGPVSEPTSLPDAKPSLLDLLNHIVPTIAAEWKMVGYALGAEHEVLNTIERYEQRIKGCAMELLALWLHRAPGTGDQPRTWHSVLGAVKTVTGNRAVKKIERKLKTIESTLDDNCQKIVESFFGRMKEYYSSMHIVEDEWFPNQTMCYVNLALADFRLGSQRAQEMFVKAFKEGVDNVYTHQIGKVECEAIPELVKEHKLVIISGAPGVGKSTLARKVCQDVSYSPDCHGYSLVLLVELRKLLHLMEDFKLVDLLNLFQGMIGDTASPKKLSKAINRNLGKGVLFILDGFDELPPHLRQSDFLVNLLSHNLECSAPLPYCHVVMTSRSIVTSEIYHKVRSGVTNVEVLGFTQKQIEEYAGHFFTDQRQPDLLDKFLRRIDSVPHIRGLCSIPVVLSIICQVFLFREDLPPTLTQIYNDYLCVKVLKYSEDLSELKSIMDISKDHDIYRLGEIAYNCIQKQKIVLDSDDLQGLGERFSDRKKGCGVLTARPIRCDPRSRKGAIDSFFFIHLTVQEFLAAVYVSLLTADSQCEIWARYLGEPHMAQVWRFYCGLTKLQHCDRLRKKINFYSVDFQMQCFFETQDISLVRRLMPRLVGEEVKVKPETAYDTTAYGYCLSVLPSLKRLTVRKGASSVEIHRLLEPVYTSGTLQTLHLPDETDWRELEVALDRLVSLEGEASTCDIQKDNAFKGRFGKVYLKRPPLSTVVKLLCLHRVTEVECKDIQGCKAMDHEVLMEMERSLLGNKTMNKLILKDAGVTLLKQFCHHLLLGIRRNKSLSEVHLSFNPQSWYCPDDVPAGDQGSVLHLAMWGVPVDVLTKLLSFFSEVKELKCLTIHRPQEQVSDQSCFFMDGVREEELKLDEITVEQILAGMSKLKKLVLGMWSGMSDSLMMTFGMSFLKGLPKQNNIVEFILYSYRWEGLLQDMLSRLPPDKRVVFTTGEHTNEHGETIPCICLSPSRSDRLSANDGDSVDTDDPPTASSDDANSSSLYPSIYPPPGRTLLPPIQHLAQRQMFPDQSHVGLHQGLTSYPNMMQFPLVTMPWQWTQVPPGTPHGASSDAPGPSGVNAPALPPAPPTLGFPATQSGLTGPLPTPHLLPVHAGMANYPNMMPPPLMPMPWQLPPVPQVPPGTPLSASSDAPGPSGMNAPALPPAPPTALEAHLTSCDSPGPSRITPASLPPASPTPAGVAPTPPPHPPHCRAPAPPSRKRPALPLTREPSLSKRGGSDEGGQK